MLSCESTAQVRYEGRLRYTFRPEQPAAGVRVDFVRTGGTPMTPSTLTGVTDSLGWTSS